MGASDSKPNERPQYVPRGPRCTVPMPPSGDCGDLGMEYIEYALPDGSPCCKALRPTRRYARARALQRHERLAEARRSRQRVADEMRRAGIGVSAGYARVRI